MSIRQLSFEEGEALNISECVKLPKNTSIEKLRELAGKTDVYIVLSGKSYYDVTSNQKIYEQAHEFDLDSLSEIERRELRQTGEMKPAFADAESQDPMSMLFTNTTPKEEEEEDELERKTYYLRAEQIEALRLICFREVKDVSEVVRELLDIAINEKSTLHGTNFLAEAKQNLMSKPRKPKKRRKRKAQI